MRFSIFKCVFLVLFFGLCTGCKNDVSEQTTQLYVSAVDSYTERDFTRALEIIGQIQKLNSSFYQAELLEAKILFFTDLRNESMVLLKKITKKYPEYTDARLWYIRALILNGNFIESEHFLERELSLNQTDWRVYYLYALLAAKQSDYQKRIEMLRRADMALADGAKVYLDLAQLWHALGVPERADTYLDKARVLTDPQSGMSDILESLDALFSGEEERK